MECQKCYLDMILIPFGLVIIISYHAWLWYKVRTQPHTTLIGLNSIGRRLWVSAMLKDIDKKNIVAVQTLRNHVMGSTLMATMSVLLCAGLAAVMSSTYSIKNLINDPVYGAHGDIVVASKYAAVLTLFLSAFFCHSLSIRFFNQLCLLMSNGPVDIEPCSVLPSKYLFELLERGTILNTIGNRIFYVALPLLLWIFGPILVFLSWVIMVPVLYNLDFFGGHKGKEFNEIDHKDNVSVVAV